MYTDDEAEVTEETSPAPNRIDLRLRSHALGRTTSALLLTPRDWSPESRRTWPVLYVLHGGDDGPECWLEHTDLARRAREDDVLVVLPDGGRAGFYTRWRAPDQFGTIPDWPRFHLVELRNLVERRYRGGDVRAVAGVSMGGYGALVYAAGNPGLFAAAASYSGMVHTTRLGTPLLLRRYLRTVGERMAAMWGGRWSSRDRWLRNDPYHLADGLLGTPVYLAAGDGNRVRGDPPAPGDRLLERIVGPASHDLARRLAALSWPATTSFGAGTHDWPSWQRELDRSWPFLVDALRSPGP
ncbi:alpha/beta hydrolase [Amycolatopsis samaneae]|uniref:Alpha/beta hydrolase family protein n=1 Tax=Amycolatopsis samaneae TaxID=664691 RepID=A0ABW5GLK7_9PSEU